MMAMTLLRTTLAYCLQFVLGLVLLLHNHLKFGLIGGLKDVCCRYFSDNSKNKHQNRQLKAQLVPKHLAVLFVDQSLIEDDCIADIIAHCFEAGVECITFYDPWSILHTNHQRLQKFLRNWVRKVAFNGRILFQSEKSDPNTAQKQLRVIVLGSSHGKQALVRVCKRLCHSPEEITPVKITEALMQDSIFEPDMLVKLGSEHWSLAGYPAYSLRVTELVEVRRFQSVGCVKKDEFHALLQQFSGRDRRIGR